MKFTSTTLAFRAKEKEFKSESESDFWQIWGGITVIKFPHFHVGYANKIGSGIATT